MLCQETARSITREAHLEISLQHPSVGLSSDRGRPGGTRGRFQHGFGDMSGEEDVTETENV